MSKKKKDKKYTILIMVGIIIVLIGLAFMPKLMSKDANEQSNVSFPDIHGIGYSGNGEKLFVAVHDGLRVYKNNQWSVPEAEKHDYMGFSSVKDGFYSSGHPSLGSNLENPLGVVKSIDEGKTIKILDLYKEMDFHLMTAGYETKVIYLFNPQENSKMNEIGFYYTNDETKTWHKSQLKALTSSPTSVAAHPTEKKVMAIGSENGVFLSKDYGENLELILPNVNVTTLSFDHNNGILISYMEDVPKLTRISLLNQEVTDIKIPTLKEDAVAYVKQNPVEENEITLATYTKDIFISKDNGDSWKQIVDNGNSK